MGKINVMLGCCFWGIGCCIMLEEDVVLVVLELGGVEGGVGKGGVGSWEGEGGEVEKGVFIVVGVDL